MGDFKLIIWISSYPRSGNTFLRTILKNCLGQFTYSIYNDNEIGGDPDLTEITGGRDSPTLEQVLGYKHSSHLYHLCPISQ